MTDQATKATLDMYAGPLDAVIFSQEYLNLRETYPEESVEIAVSEMAQLAIQFTESSVKGADNFVYTKTMTGRRPNYSPVFGLNQMQRAAAVMLLLRKRVKMQYAELDHVHSAVTALATRAAELEAEASKLTRWDLFLMAIFGKEIVTERIRRRRVAENKPAIEL